MKRKYYYLISVFVIIVAVAFLIFKGGSGEKLVPLKANVVYTDQKFTISNNDTIDFIHADISIDEYYKLRDINLQTGETYTIWQTEFLHCNGTHYPIKRKPVQFAIWCKIKDGRNGFYSKKFR